eukprot:s681_g13.t1
MEYLGVRKTSGGSPKMQKTIAQELLQSIMKWRAGSMGAGLQKVAKDALSELVKAGDVEEPSEDVEAVSSEFCFDTAKSLNEEAAKIAAGEFSVSQADEADTKEDCQMVKKVETFWSKHASFGTLVGELKSHILSVSESVIREGHKKKLPGPKVVEELQLALQQICQCCKDQVEDFLKAVPENVEALGSGLLVKLYKTVLEIVLELIWTRLPAALYAAGWSDEAPFSLMNLTWILGAFFGAIVGLGRAYLPEEAGLQEAVTNMNVWVRELHGPNGSAPCGPWVLGLVLLSLLTAFAGASVGPEPVVIIMPSVVYVGLVKKLLNPSVQVLRVAALAGGAGGLAAFFGLPLASAFFAMEIPHMDGAEFALEAFSACVVAGVVGTIVGHCIWEPSQLLGNSRFWFPGGDSPDQPQITTSEFGMGAVSMGILAGIVGGLTSYLLVTLMRGWHPLFEHIKHIKHQHRWKALRYSALLAVVGAANAAMSFLYPSALWWGEDQLQVVLTRGCSFASGTDFLLDCEPVKLKYLYEKLIYKDAIVARPGVSMSGWEMFGLGLVKLVMISMCEGAGFVGGPIYPIIFATGAMGSALGATDWVATLGGQYVYICTAAAMSTGLAALLHTQVFGILIVMELQANIPHGSVSSQTIALMTAVYSFYLLRGEGGTGELDSRRTLVAPYFQLVSQQKTRQDLQYLTPEPEPETDTEDDSNDTDLEMEPWKPWKALCRDVLGDDFDGQHQEGYDKDTLLRVENMLLMYGAGKLLLKDTVLEMKANRRYGVVGHNGAGKTTLMKEIVAGRIVGMPTHLRCVHVDDSKLGEMSKSSLNALEYVQKKALEQGVTDASAENLRKVGFPEKMFEVPVAELSTGWRMRLTLAVSMLKHADIVLLDEPTNHLDQDSVDWLGDYLLQLTKSSVMVISHEPKFLNKICTDIISYKDKALVYTEGNFDAFVMAKGIKADDIEALLSGNLKLDEEEEGEEGAEDKKVALQAPIAGPPKISFPIPGSVEGVKSSSKAVIEFKNLSFRYGKDKDYLISDVAGKLSLGSRVAMLGRICGRNGCGKSTLMTLICSEMNPTENKDGKLGEITRHCNLRVAYMKQDHLKTLGPYFDTSPLNYITQRFKNGYDEELQKRLIEPEDDEEAARRATLAKQYGKYGNPVGELLTRSKQGSQLYYEVRWEGLDDPKQNTMVSLKTLRDMGLDKVVIACDERIAAKAAGLDQRPLTRREIVKHCEGFGFFNHQEMCCNQQIRGFSAGQKVRLSLAAMFWTKPHFIAVDEPTNYLDVETVEALSKALNNFRGGILMIEPKMDFVEKVCNETWTLEDGKITVQKLDNGLKRVLPLCQKHLLISLGFFCLPSPLGPSFWFSRSRLLDSACNLDQPSSAAMSRMLRAVALGLGLATAQSAPFDPLDGALEWIKQHGKEDKAIASVQQKTHESLEQFCGQPDCCAGLAAFDKEYGICYAGTLCTALSSHLDYDKCQATLQDSRKEWLPKMFRNQQHSMCAQDGDYYCSEEDTRLLMQNPECFMKFKMPVIEKASSCSQQCVEIWKKEEREHPKCMEILRRQTKDGEVVGGVLLDGAELRPPAIL